MRQKILIFGSMPENDAALMRMLASGWEMDLMNCSSEQESVLSSCGQPAAVISYVPCNAKLILDMYRNQPVGFGEKVPLFQCVQGEAVPPFLYDLPLCGVFRTPLNESAALNILLSINRNSTLLKMQNELFHEITKFRSQKDQLVRIGAALSNELDIKALLELILTASREIVGADAGSIYTRDKNGPEGTFSELLRFRVTQNDSLNIKSIDEFTLPISSQSIAGHVALTGKPLPIDDVYQLGEDVPYKFGRDFDRKTGYRSRSMLSVPLKHLDGEIVGVLQLINKKLDMKQRLESADDVAKYVAPFSMNDQDIIQSIASFAAVSIERVTLYENIKGLFEGFLSSSTAAIDERDRVTYGHSKRVMGYAMSFYEAVQQDPACPFSELTASPDRKRQFQIAALLHDIGKIGVPEHLLTKEHRLEAGEMQSVLARLDYIELALKYEPELVDWESAEEISDDRDFLLKVNRSGFLSDAECTRLQLLRKKKYSKPTGEECMFLSESEFEHLSVRKGNLTEKEREIINSHAMSTFRILSKLPWTRSLEKVPEIACHHHEKLDGSGYPHGLVGEQIPLESRILAVIDIYEALVAQDRPYKPKMLPEKALEILKFEAGNNHLDPQVVDFFIEKKIYNLYPES